MADTPSVVYDLYASLLNYKKPIAYLVRDAVSVNWVPVSHRRRLQAYELLASYWDNYSRDFRKAPNVGTENKNEELSEQGDVFWLCEKLKNKLIGSDLSISVSIPSVLGSDEYYAEFDKREAVDAGAKRIVEERRKLYTQAKYISKDREAYLQAWFKDEKVFNVININESKCSALGDCVYMLGWNETKKTVEIKTYDPAFCFPYFYTTYLNPSWEEGADPVTERFILAWEEEKPNQSDVSPGELTSDKFLVYREVYELRKSKSGELRCWRHRAHYNYGTDVNVVLTNFSDDELFDAGQIKQENIDAGGYENEETEWEDLGIDFVPKVWIPNIAREGEEPFGMSNIQHVLDLLDKLINNDTDLATNAEYLGGAIIGLSGKNIRLRKDSSGEPIAIKTQPRTVYVLGEDGDMSLIDTSNMQKALLETINHQFQKLLQILDIPSVLAGGNAGGDLPQLMSGTALRMLMQPLVDRILPMRGDRQARYATMFTYVQKLFLAYGDDYAKLIFAGELFPITLNFGEIVPMDEKEEVDKLNAMKGLFSKKTILTLAKEAGIAHIDVDMEIEALKGEADEETQKQNAMFGFNNSGAGAETETETETETEGEETIPPKE